MRGILNGFFRQSHTGTLSTKHFFPLPSAGYLFHRSDYFADKSVILRFSTFEHGTGYSSPLRVF
jgi:hypothetical protein